MIGGTCLFFAVTSISRLPPAGYPPLHLCSIMLGGFTSISISRCGVLGEVKMLSATTCLCVFQGFYFELAPTGGRDASFN